MGVNNSTLNTTENEEFRKSNLNNNNTTTTTTSTSQSSRSPITNNVQQTNKGDDEDIDEELSLYISSMKINNNTQSDLDLILIQINDKVVKKDYEKALQLLKQFVYITIEAITRTRQGSVSDSQAYNKLYEKYHIPSISKLEDLYQSTRVKSEETIRNNNETDLINLSMILSIVQQLKFKLLQRNLPPPIPTTTTTTTTEDPNNNSNQPPPPQQQQDELLFNEEDEGLSLYTQYQRKLILQDCTPMVRDLLRVNQQLVGDDIKTKSKSIENCSHSLKKILTNVVRKVADAVDLSRNLWRFNNILLNKFNLQLRAWDPSKLTIPLHNQSAMYLDQIYSILFEKIKDNQLINRISDVNLKLEDIIVNLEFGQGIVETIQSLLTVDEILKQIASISEISHKYYNFILEESKTNKTPTELKSMMSRIQEIMTSYIALESQYFQLSFSYAVYMDNLRKMVYTLKNPNSLIINDISKQQQQQKHPNLEIQEITTSTMVNDIFFVFKKVVGRSLSTHNAPSACAIVNLSSSNFDILYIPTDFESNEINDPFVMDFITNLYNLLNPYRKKLSDGNFDQLVHMISTHIAKTIEEHIMQK
eukprot:gene9167-11235_t